MSQSAELEQLQTGAAGLDIELSVEQGERLMGYMRLLESWNEKFNLVSRRDVGRLLSRHVLDSLSIASWLRGERILDIGSGAGFPGIPLAVVNAHRRFLLVDRGERKARFLEHVVMTFELDNVEVRCANAAELSGEHPFSSVVCRAVVGLEAMWKMAEPLLEADGRLLFMNRTDSQEDSALDAEVESLRSSAALNVVAEQVRINGLPTPHQVLIVERQP